MSWAGRLGPCSRVVLGVSMRWWWRGKSARVVVTAEAIGRGETGAGPRAALSPVAWVRRHAPSTVAGGAGQVVAVAEAFAVAGKAPVKDAVCRVRCRW